MNTLCPFHLAANIPGVRGLAPASTLATGADP